MKQDNLINLISKLSGVVRLIKYEDGAPVIFLFDENHDNPNSSIEKSIENAKMLINEANIILVGVESLAGGSYWDNVSECYEEDPDKHYREDVRKFTNGCTTFADGVNKFGESLIVGVESVEIHYRVSGVDENERMRLHELRTKHFIKTLLEEYRNQGGSGNMILNCGMDHNSRIEKWVENGGVDEMTNSQFTYVRINTFTQ